jgi:beta-lactamase regulating signal transducer with metallopeptidase domain
MAPEWLSFGASGQATLPVLAYLQTGFAAEPVSASFLKGLRSNAELMLAVAMAAGLLWFSIDCVRHFALLRRLEQGSTAGAHIRALENLVLGNMATKDLIGALRIQKILPGAITTGILKPRVWIHRDLVNDPNLIAVLLHESRHIRHHDNLYLLLITLIDRLFWWNPAIAVLSATTRGMQELSCDEACANEFPDYRKMLNRLILVLSESGKNDAATPLGAGMFNNDNFNVHRVRVLNRRHTMKPKHYISTALLVAGSFLTINLVTAQAEPQQSNNAGTESQNSRTQEEIRAGLELYAKNLEEAYVELKAEKEALERTHAELQRAHRELQEISGSN